MVTKTWVAALVCGAVALSAQAAPFTNGSFETWTGGSPGAFTNQPAGSTAITGWTVVGAGGVDYIGTYWTAADGVRSIDLSGSGSAGTGVEQSFDTVPGTTYTVTFSLSGNTDCGPAVKTVSVSATPGGAPASYTHDITGTALPAIPWSPRTYSFTATSATTLLSFTTPDTTACGPALDNVIVTAAPVAAVPTLSQWSLGLLTLALGVVALRRRRGL